MHSGEPLGHVRSSLRLRLLLIFKTVYKSSGTDQNLETLRSQIINRLILFEELRYRIAQSVQRLATGWTTEGLVFEYR
jgi:hypothetical protein